MHEKRDENFSKCICRAVENRVKHTKGHTKYKFKFKSNKNMRPLQNDRERGKP